MAARGVSDHWRWVRSRLQPSGGLGGVHVEGLEQADAREPPGVGAHGPQEPPAPGPGPTGRARPPNEIPPPTATEAGSSGGCGGNGRSGGSLPRPGESVLGGGIALQNFYLSCDS